MQLADIDLLDPDRFVAQEHHEMFEVLRREAPVFWHEEPGGPGFWNITRYDDLVEVNRQPELFSSELGGISIFDMDRVDGSESMDLRGAVMIMTDPPKHTRYRRLVNKGFTPRMIGIIEQHLRRRAVTIVDNVIERGECDFVVDIAAELPLQAIAEMNRKFPDLDIVFIESGGDNLAEGEFTVHVSGLTATVNGETVVEGGGLVE